MSGEEPACPSTLRDPTNRTEGSFLSSASLPNLSPKKPRIFSQCVTMEHPLKRKQRLFECRQQWETPRSREHSWGARHHDPRKSKRGVGFALPSAVATVRCTGRSDTLQDAKLGAMQHSAESLPASQNPLQGDLCYERAFQLRRKNQSQTLVLASAAEDEDSLAVTVHRHAAGLQAITTHCPSSVAPLPGPSRGP